MKLSILHTGEVCVSPYLPFGNGCNLLQAAGLTTLPKNRLWIPVSCYLIEHQGKRLLVDRLRQCAHDPNVQPQEIIF